MPLPAAHRESGYGASMARTELESLTRALDAAYRSDRFHAPLSNLEDVNDEEWEALPADHSAEVFGTSPQLSIVDLVQHVGTAKLMWHNHAFGDRSLSWESVRPESHDRAIVLAWLDQAQRGFVASVEALADDGELRVDRVSHWGQLLPTARIISIVINHDLYHSGEINPQRTLIRGTDGWEQPG